MINNTELNKEKFIKTEQNILNRFIEYSNNLKENDIKILVSYIKPSFLFKSDILVPIHLGRTIAKDNSKDGTISDADLAWLHENCIGDDDFEDNISYLNRRLGFFTGTWWAYKNYEKLNNPEYFGSFGYRRLLDPCFLPNIYKYDMILPTKTSVGAKTLKQIFLTIHGENLYNIMMNVFKDIYPNEYDDLEQYLSSTAGYYYEIYILKKHLFFDMCEWLNKYVKEFFKRFPEKIDGYIPSKIQVNEKEQILKFLDMNKEEYCTALGDVIRDYSKDKRDLAFIMERITGYYLWKLTQNKKISFIEVPIIETKSDFRNPIQQLILSKIKQKVKNDYLKGKQ